MKQRNRNVFILPLPGETEESLTQVPPETFTELGMHVRKLLAKEKFRLTGSSLQGFRPNTSDAVTVTDYFTKGLNFNIDYLTNNLLSNSTLGYFKFSKEDHPEIYARDLFSIVGFIASTYRDNTNVAVFLPENLLHEALPHYLHDRLNLKSLSAVPSVGEMLYLSGDIKGKKRISYEIISGFHRSDSAKTVTLSDKLK